MSSAMRSAARLDPGFGVYIHWPFCAQKCPYCDFNSHVRHGGWDESRFLTAYKRELDHVASLIGKREVQSIFFGGGTPSLMQPQTVSAILDHIAALWSVVPHAEITIEANPGSVEAERFSGYRAAGVNRVSMGLQSLNDAELKKLGRIHTVAESRAALEIARKTFERYSFDLIYARPGQTADAWRTELGEALELAGDHLSLYQLTIEPDTPYAALHAAGKLIVPDPDAALALYAITQDMTANAGLDAYEISNHARAGEESRHNLLYWRYGEYAGVGPGAHGRIIADGQRTATVTEKNPEAWCTRVERDGHGFTERTALSPHEQADEALLMGLRLKEGVAVQKLIALGGCAPDQTTLDGLANLGLIEVIENPKPAILFDGKNELDPIPACVGPGLGSEISNVTLLAIRATPRGRFVLNAVVAELSKSLVPVAAESFRVDSPSNAL